MCFFFDDLQSSLLNYAPLELFYFAYFPIHPLSYLTITSPPLFKERGKGESYLIIFLCEELLLMIVSFVKILVYKNYMVTTNYSCIYGWLLL